jgi:site-specific DNA-methyltransferase (adenine-specific)
LREASILKRAEFFENDGVLIINDSVFDTKKIAENSIDLIVTSPPYNVDIKYNSHDDQISYKKYLEFSEKWMRRCYKWLKDDGRFCLNIPLDKNKGGQQSVGADLTYIAKKNVKFKYHSTIIWNEGNISRRTAWGSWKSASAPYVIAPVELIIVFYKKKWKKTSGSLESTIDKKHFMDWTNGLWSFNGESKKKIGHPAPFPVQLPERCIQLFSYKYDTVLDPFLGSGSTLVAAYLNNRKGIGIDIDKHYCEIAINRLKNEANLKLTAQKPIEIKSGKSLKPKKPDTQINALMQFFIKNPNRNISYPEVKEWIETNYKTKKGSEIIFFKRKIRKLFEQGKLIRVIEGVYRYES